MKNRFTPFLLLLLLLGVGFNAYSQTQDAPAVFQDVTGIVIFPDLPTTAGATDHGQGDDVLKNVTLPFSIGIYGDAPTTSIDISTNGWISDASVTSSDLSNSCPYPDPTFGQGRLAVYHDDIDMEVGSVNSNIWTMYFPASAPGHPFHPLLGDAVDAFVIHWSDAQDFPGVDNPLSSEVFDFGAILYADGSVVYLYGDNMGNADQNGASTAIDGTFGAETFGCNTAGYLPINQAGPGLALFLQASSCTFDCPANITVDNKPGNCFNHVIWDRPIPSAGCGGDSVVVTTSHPGCVVVQNGAQDEGDFPVGTTTVTYSVWKDGNVIIDCSFDITVEDTEAPQLTGCPQDIVAYTWPGNCKVPVNYIPPTASDNCPGVTVSAIAYGPGADCLPDQSNVVPAGSGGEFDVGVTEIHYIATDAAGNTSVECIFTITVLDVDAPVITCPADVTAECSDDLSPAAQGMATALDNCDPNPVITWSDASTQDPDIFACGHYTYTITRTWTATDWSGNSSSCDQIIEVQDVTPPTFTTPADVTISCEQDPLDVNITGDVTDEDDNCAASSIVSGINTADWTYSEAPFAHDGSVDESGAPASVVLTGADDGTNNAQSNYSTVSAGGPLSFDWDFSSTNGSAFWDPFGYTVNGVFTQLTADGGGVVQSGSETVVLNAGDVFAFSQRSLDGIAGAGVTTISNVTLVSSALGQATFSDVVDLSGCGGYTGTITRTWSLSDPCGNTTTGVQTITIVDETDPALLLPADLTISCEEISDPSAQTVLDFEALEQNNANNFNIVGPVISEDGYDILCTLAGSSILGDYLVPGTGSSVYPGSTTLIHNNFDFVSIIQTQSGASFTAYSIDLTPVFFVPPFNVEFIGVLAAGGTVSQTFTVTPGLQTYVFDCAFQGLTSLQFAQGGGAIDGFQFDNVTLSNPTLGVASAIDNCDPCVDITHSDVIIPGSCVNEYTIERTWTATDDCGNSSSGTQTIEVIDDTAPVLDCPLGNAPFQQDDFDGYYSAGSWTEDINSTDGDVDASGAPASIVLTGANDGTDDAETNFGIEIPADGTLSFDWDFSSSNGSAFWDPFGYILNGSFVQLTADGGGVVQSGSVSIGVSAGDQFAFSQRSLDGIAGAGVTTISNFSGPSLQFTLDCHISQAPPYADIAALIAAGGSVSDNCDLDSASWSVQDVWDGNSCPGIVTRTYSISDVCGNTTTCTQVFYIDDEQDPVWTNQPADLTIECDQDPFDLTLTGEATADDNCIVTVDYSDVSTQGFSGCPKYQYVITRTWTATDSCDNSISFDQLIYVDDTTPPAITCPVVNATYDNAPGECGVYVSMGDATASDNCDPFPVIDHNSQYADNAGANASGYYPVGVHTITFTATDPCGNASTCDITFEVLDVEDPTVESCPSNDSYMAITGDCSALVSWPEPSFDDNCGVVNVDASNDANKPMITAGGTVIATFPVGTTTVTYVASDAAGNTATCTFQITVTDMEDPQITGCPADITVDQDAGACEATVYWNEFNIIPSDNCPGVQLSCSHHPGDVFPTGTTTVTYTATDASGNTAECSFDVTVADTVAPVISCPADVTIECDEATDPLVNGSLGVASATDNCDPDFPVTYPDAQIDYSDVVDYSGCGGYTGTITRTWTATDWFGNSASCVQVITVVDTEAPIYTEAPGQLDITIQCDESTDPSNTGTPSPNDNCTYVLDINLVYNDVSTQGNNPNECDYYTYTITRTWTATDACGNSTDYVQVIDVVDDTDPTFTGPADVTIECDANTDPAATGMPTDVMDNCSSLAGGTEVWINEFHYDNSGSDTGEFIEVAGTAGTDLTGWSIVLYNGSNGTTYGLISLSGTLDDEGDGYGALSFAQAGIQNGAPDGFALVDPSNTVISFLSYEGSFTATAGVASGMTSTNVGVSETSGTPAGQSLQLIGIGGSAADFSWSGPSAESPGDLNAGQTGASMGGGLSVTFSDVTDLSGCGGYTGTITRTWRVEDACGNFAESTQIITIVDETDPTFTVPADITISCEESTDPSNTGDVNDAADNCGVGGGQMDKIWVNEFHYDNQGGDVGEFIEIAGNAGADMTGFSLVLYNGSNGTVYNTIPLAGTIPDEGGGFGATAYNLPSNGLQNGSPDGIALVGPGAIVHCFLSYEGSFTASNGPAAGMMTVNIGVSENSGTPIGSSLQLTGTGSLPTDFTWSGPDAESPGALNAGQTVLPLPNPGLTLTYNDDVDLTDCGNYTGTITRTWTLEDACGNTTEQDQVITVVDNTAPVLSCPADFTINNDPGVCEALVTIDVSATDNCDQNVSIVNDQNGQGANYSEVLPVGGPYTITFTATDACGNQDVCSVSVTVVDNEPPVPDCIAGPINKIAIPGACVEQASWPIPTATDNCGYAGYSQSNTANAMITEINGTAFGIFPVGTTTVTYLFFDIYGNVSSCSFDIIVEDQEDPTITGCPADITVPADAGSCDAVVYWNEFNIQANDNCPQGLQLTCSHHPGDVFPILAPGQGTEVTYTATDASGNSSTCSFTVYVIDVVDPVVTCPADLTIECDESSDPANTGSATGTDDCDPDGVDITYSDVSTQGNDPTQCDYYNYTITRTWVATDWYGNTDACDQVITVEDTQAPTFTVPADITIECDQNPLDVGVTGDVFDENDNCAGGSVGGINTADWTYSEAPFSHDGSVDESNAPTSVTLVGANDGTDNAQSNYSQTFGSAGTFAFTWSYSTNNGSAFWDPFGYSINGTFFQLTDDGGPLSQSGTETISLSAGDVFAFSQRSLDGIAGAGSTTISGVSFGTLDASFTDNVDLSGCGGYTGTITRTWSLSDPCGNTTSHVQTITIVDETAPLLVAPSDLTLSCEDDASASGTVTVDFESLEQNNANDFNVIGATVAEDGYDILCTLAGSSILGNYLVPGTGSAVYPGSTTLIHNDFTFVTIVQTQSGQAFSISSIDLAPVFFVPPFNVEFTGVKAGGGTVTTTFTVTPGLQSFSFGSEFSGLTSLQFAQGGGAIDAFQFDNLVLSNPAVGVADAQDNCDNDVVVDFSDNIIPGSCDNEYTIERTWSATDACGNVSTDLQVIEIIDNTAPVFAGPLGVVPGQESGFNGYYSVGGWDVSINSTDGSVDVSGAPSSVLLIGANDGTDDAETNFGIEIPTAGTLSFDWNYSSNNGSAFWDPFGYILNGTFVQLTADGGGVVQSGSVSIGVSAGDQFAFSQRSLDGIAGAGSATISNFSAPTLLTSLDCDISQLPPYADLAAFLAAGGEASDNCDLDTLSFSLDSEVSDGNSCPEVVTRVYSISDICGNTSSWTQTIIIDDEEDPVWTNAPANVMIQCDESTDPSNTGQATASDNCNVTVAYSDVSTQGQAGCPQYQYTITRTWTATDDCGNQISHTQVITVVDTEAPTLTCPGNMVVSNDPGQCSAQVSVIATVSDNCSDVSEIAVTNNSPYAADPNSLDASGVYPVGVHVVTFTATDICGNTTSCSTVITVNDDEDPVLDCAADITVSNTAGNCGATVFYPFPTATDNCPGVIVTQVAGLGSGAYFPVGTTAEQFMAMDAAGNTSMCTINIVVTDDEDPVITGCPSDITVSNDPGSCDAVVYWDEANIVVSDNCPGESLACSHHPGDVFPKGTTTVTYTATDAAGNTAVCTFDVTVNDDEGPSIVCPGNINVTAPNGTTSTIVTWADPVGTDNCPNPVTVQTAGPVSGSDLAAGTYVVEYEVTDCGGNVETCSFTITVECGILASCETTNWGNAAGAPQGAGAVIGQPLLLKGLPFGITQKFFFVGGTGNYEAYPDGTALFSGTLVNGNDPNICFQMSIMLENKMDWATWSALGRGYYAIPANQATADANHMNWDYYEISASSTLIGCAGSTYAGDVLNLTHRPSDYAYGFQVGIGANGGDSDDGAGGWFWYSGSIGGQAVTMQKGDLNVDFTNCNLDPCGGIMLAPRVYLASAYDIATGHMRTDLADNGYLPLTEPHSALGFPQIGSGNESVNPIVFNNNAQNTIVDWVLVALEDALNPGQVVMTANALLQSDGDVVGLDGVSALEFVGVPAGDYYVSITHRNHVKIYTAVTISLSGTVTFLDFTDGTTQVYDDNQLPIGAFSGMVGGDASGDEVVAAVDRSIAWNERNTLGYVKSDIDLDGASTAADRSFIWNNKNFHVKIPQ